MVESIIAYSLSASSDRWLKTLSQTPLLAHRLNRVWFPGRHTARASPAMECRPDNDTARPPRTAGCPSRSRRHGPPAPAQILDAVPLVVAKGVASHRQLQITLTAYEALPTLPGNPLIEDRPLVRLALVRMALGRPDRRRP